MKNCVLLPFVAIVFGVSSPESLVNPVVTGQAAASDGLISYRDPEDRSNLIQKPGKLYDITKVTAVVDGDGNVTGYKITGKDAKSRKGLKSSEPLEIEFEIGAEDITWTGKGNAQGRLSPPRLKPGHQIALVLKKEKSEGSEGEVVVVKGVFAREAFTETGVLEAK